jgi:hypothetical protein
LIVGAITKTGDGHGGTLIGDPPIAVQTDAQPAALINPHHA